MPIMNKYIWRFFRPILIFNLLASLFYIKLGPGFFLAAFSLLTFIPVCAFVLFFDKSGNLVYYNLGYSRRRLLMLSFLWNFLTGLLIALILYYVRK